MMPEIPSPGRRKKKREVPHEATRLESVKEIRRALKARRARSLKRVHEATAQPPVDAGTKRYRPVRRAPLALLCILDDGLEDGEWVRLRGDRVIIGRSEGNIVLAYDSMLSGQHAELSRRLDQGRYRWHLTDLDSTNGTYVRVGDAPLRHGQELLIGSRRYRFDAPGQATPEAESESGLGKPRATRDWESVALAEVLPSLVELTAKGDGECFVLAKAENWIGRDRRCAVVIVDDQLVSPRHARFYRDNKGRWHVENGRALNGTWLRTDHMALDSACQFQLGEQRFIFKVL